MNTFGYVLDFVLYFFKIEELDYVKVSTYLLIVIDTQILQVKDIFSREKNLDLQNLGICNRDSMFKKNQDDHYLDIFGIL